MLTKALKRLAKVESVETVLARDMGVSLAPIHDTHAQGGKSFCSEETPGGADKQEQSEEPQQMRKRRRVVGLPEGEHCFTFKCTRPFVDPIYIIDLFKEKVANGHVPVIEKIAVARQALNALPLLGPVAISNIFHACKVGYFIHKELLSALGHKVVHCESLLKSFRDVNMCMMLNALGMLEKHRKDLSRSQAGPEATAGGQALFPGCAELVRALVHECIKREAFGEHEATERGMANIIHALGWLYKDGASIDADRGGGVLADLLINKMINDGSIQRCTVKELCIVLHGLANMKYGRDEILGQLCNEIREWLEIRQMKASADTQQKILRYRKLFGEGVDMYSELGANEVSMLMWALGKLNYRHPSLLEVLAVEVQRCVKLLNAQGISNVVYGMAQLGYRNDRILDAISAELVSGHRLRRFKSQGLSNVTFGFARLDYRNEKAILALGRETVNPNTVKNFTDKNLGNLVQSWSKLGDRRNSVLDGLTLEIIKPTRLSNFDCEALATVVGGLGECWYSKPRVNAALRSAVLQGNANGLHHEPSSLGMLFSGFGKLGIMDRELFTMLCSETTKHMVASQISGAAAVKVLLGLGWCPDFDKGLVIGLLESVGLPQPLLNSTLVNCLCGLILLAPEILESQPALLACNSLMGRISKELRRPERLLGMTQRNAAIFCWLVARLGYCDKDLLDGLIARYLKGSDGGAKLKDDIVMIMYACSVFQHQHSLLFHKLKKWLEARTGTTVEMNRLVDLTWGMGSQGPSQVGGHYDPSLLPRFSFEHLASQLLVDPGMVSLVVGFERGLALSASRRGMSKRGKELRNELDQLNIRFEHGDWMQGGVMVFGYPVMVWVIEPQGYFINKVKGATVLTGQSEFQLQSLRRSRLQIVSIPYFDWDGRNSEDRQLLLKNRLADCGFPPVAGQAIA